MPVKVRCGGCEQVLNVPDKARGKTIACPKCSGKIKVPGGQDAPTKAPPKAKPKDDDTFLGGLDDHGLEDQEEGICPFCAKPVDFEEDETCPSCGRDLVTGEMAAKEKKRRSKGGRSSAYFYKNFLRECWEFTKEFKTLAFRTGMYNTMFTLMFFASIFMVEYCDNIPPMVFWFALSILTGVATPGWFWFLSKKIVSSDLYGEKLESDRIFYDFFTVVSLGLGLCIWPFLLALPFLHALSLVSLGRHFEVIPPEVFLFVWVGIAGMSTVFAAFVFPVATIHLLAKHKHKAWILADLFVIAFKNIGPIMVYHVTAICLILPLMAIPALMQFAGGGVRLFDNTHFLGWADQAVTWCLKMTGENNPVPGGFVFSLIKIGFMFTFAAIALAPYHILAGFPAIFLMKLNGLIAKHFTHTLDLDQRIMVGTPATFWVRFLAGATDYFCVPFAALLVTQDSRFTMIAWAVNSVVGLLVGGYFMDWFDLYMVQAASLIWFLYMNWMYYAVPLASANRATLGMEAFGLIGVRDNQALKPKELEKPMTLKEASVRWFLHLVLIQGMFGFISLSGLFQKDGKALHDILSKTRIAFKGDK